MISLYIYIYICMPLGTFPEVKTLAVNFSAVIIERCLFLLYTWNRILCLCIVVQVDSLMTLSIQLITIGLLDSLFNIF